MVLSTIFALSSFGGKVSATSCRDIEFIYARGSGAARNGSAEWRQFNSAMAKIARRRGYSYRVTDLNYPAIAVSNPANALGAKISGGLAYAFGRSVDSGVTNLKNYYQSVVRSCPNTLWVLGGYSQGALVVERAVKVFKAAKVVYVGLFGDPWTYLPEGKGLNPKACRGRDLSAYRVYAPDCKTYSGSLGMQNPYVPSGLNGKYGLWCNRRDYVCGSTRLLFNNSGHLKYAEYNDFVWMAEKVEKKLPSRTRLATLANKTDEEGDDDLDEVEDLIEAHLSSDEYLVSSSGTVTLDASNSFSLGHEIVDYQWSVKGEDFWSSGTESSIQRDVFFPRQYTVRLKIVDDAGRTAEASAKIVVYEGEPQSNVIAAPNNATAEYKNGEINVQWTEKNHYRAEYILFRINDVDLGYLPVSEYTGTIDDIEDIDNTVLKVAWLDKNFEVGEWAEVEITRPEPQEVNIEPVQTGLAQPSISLFASLLGALGIVAVVIIIGKKYLPR